MPSLFSLGPTHDLFQVWFVVYLYALPLALYASWAALSFMDMAESGEISTGWSLAVVGVPVLGGACYLLFRARPAAPSARLATVAMGLLVWILPLAVGLWLAGGALGPKAL